MKRLDRNVETLVPDSLKPVIDARIGDARRLMVWEEPIDEESLSNNSRRSMLPCMMDYILLDVPCSGEGIIYLPDEKSLKHWSVKSVLKRAKLQAQLIDNAYHLLKPGGEIVYSTCTLSPQENEDIIQTFLDQKPGMEIIDLGIPFLESNISNFQPGFTHCRDKEYHADMQKALRIFPNELYEGFFVCKLRKRKQ
jgi:16S rRNA (cytosine1407-C5)-methyltransferase